MGIVRRGGICVAVAATISALAVGPALADPWGGLYVGVHAGGSWSDVDWTYITGPADLGGPPGASVSQEHEGFIGGGQVGYEHRMNNIVAGVELSYSGGEGLQSETTTSPFEADETIRTDLNGLFTATAKLGLVLNDSWMIYAKGGYASANISVDTFDPDVFIGIVSAAAHTSERHNGWTIGGGFEYALSSNLTLGVEYAFIDLSSETHSTLSLASDGLTFPYDIDVEPDNIQSVSLRLNFKLDGAAAP
ncbi:MAG: outer membrane protein [Hyphomicrobium sp.]